MPSRIMQEAGVEDLVMLCKTCLFAGCLSAGCGETDVQLVPSSRFERMVAILSRVFCCTRSTGRHAACSRQRRAVSSYSRVETEIRVCARDRLPWRWTHHGSLQSVLCLFSLQCLQLSLGTHRNNEWTAARLRSFIIKATVNAHHQP